MKRLVTTQNQNECALARSRDDQLVWIDPQREAGRTEVNAETRGLAESGELVEGGTR